MRLWSCVAVELAIGGTLVAGAVVGALALADWAEVLISREAQAAEARAQLKPFNAELDRSELATVPSVGLFEGVADEVLLAPIKSGNIKTIKYNRGGSSISLRIDFDNGARAAFKPEQLIEHTVPRREVAAYRVSRMLGLSGVPPAVGRRLSAAELFEKLRPDSRVFVPRMREEMAIVDGKVAGELSWWIPVIAIGKIGKYDIDSIDGIVTWTKYLTAGQPIAHADRGVVRQISEMVVFDFLIDNVDRWSGSNARMSKDGRTLYFMDNTASFGIGRPGSGRTRAYLHKVQKLSRSLIQSLTNLSADDVREGLTPDGDAFAELLSDDEIRALLARRDFILDYVTKLISSHGREAVMVFP